MKFIIFSAIFLTICILHSTSGLLERHVSPDPKHPGKCWVNNHAYSPGDHFFKPQCEKLTCNRDGTGAIDHCAGYSPPPPGFKYVADNSKDYPHCCATLVKVYN